MRKKVIILALFFVLFTSGCSLSFKKSTEVKDWEDEVLLVQDCGLEGLACCLDKENKCESGQICCFSPNDQNINECASECFCGRKDSFCCENNTCNENLICSNGRCIDCGEEEEACCENNTCNENLLCFQGICLECGNPNSPCCQEEIKCNKNPDSELRIECINNICKNCGRDANIVCQEEPKCDLTFFPTNNICMQCGNFNQPCCVTTDTEKYDCDKTKDLSCIHGFCATNN